MQKYFYGVGRAYWCIMRKGDVFKEHMLTKTMSFHN